MTPETSPAAEIRPARDHAQELTPGREKGQHSVWDALTNIFEDLDKQGGGPEAEELEAEEAERRAAEEEAEREACSLANPGACLMCSA